VLGILTHGNYHEGVATILFKDRSYVNLDHVMMKFQNNNCVDLVGKPKIFLFPFCRGDVSDHGVYIRAPRHRVEHDALRDISAEESWPTYSDILICYATVAGFRTHRDVNIS
jgi:hypothetical protein